MTTPNITAVASLIGDPSRAAMLMNLLGGKALPASELARVVHVTPQTASSHLAKMLAGGIVLHESFGRHRYYRLASPEVGHALEALSVIAPPKPIRSLRESDQSKALHFARTCYDHIAGEVGVALTDRMLELAVLEEGEERNFVATPDGIKWLRHFGIDLGRIRHGRRHFARQCLDWSERRPHIAGALGAVLADRLFYLEWISRVPGGRAVQVTDKGFKGLQEEFGLTLDK